MTVSANRLTEKAQEAISAAQRLAEERSHTQLEPEHLLYALADQSDGVVPSILERLGVPPAVVLEELEPSLGAFARASGAQQLQVSNRLSRVLDAARRRSRAAQGRVHLDRAPPARPRRRGGQRGGRPAPAPARRHPRPDLPEPPADPRRSARDEPEPGDDLRGARAVRARPDRARPRRASWTR